MARRTFDVIDVTDYAAPGIMRRARAPQGGTRWPTGFWLPEHAA